MEELKDRKSEDVKLKESLRKLADSMGAEAQRQENEEDVRFNRRRSRSRDRRRSRSRSRDRRRDRDRKMKRMSGSIEGGPGLETDVGQGQDLVTGEEIVVGKGEDPGREDLVLGVPERDKR